MHLLPIYLTYAASTALLQALCEKQEDQVCTMENLLLVLQKHREVK